MKTPEQALDCIAAAYRCPDVAMTETIALIQLDAFKTGAHWANKRSELMSEKDMENKINKMTNLEDL